jgi:hypothetical protein
MLSAFAKVKTLPTAPKPTVNFAGKWVNELGSEMTLSVTPTGEVSGTYRTAVGAPGGSEKFDLRGFASGDLLSFTVNFGKYGTLTSWVGQHTDDGQGAIIKSLWILARNIEDPDEPGQLWGSVLTGYNNFTR